ncbi:MAG: 2-dehydro-3-deoxygalactonokinase, partial [Betaproteobacteria bacterium]|nr:2-dehydro-3-deoxygalactonokinase [Betaproteobacteria bacterium]
VSGLLIGEEIQAAKADLMAEGTPLLILGNGQLTLRYSMAMAALGLTAQTLAEDVTWTGLWALAHHLYPHDFN